MSHARGRAEDRGDTRSGRLLVIAFSLILAAPLLTLDPHVDVVGNRPARTLPPLSAGSWADEGTYRAVDASLRDHLRSREWAVESVAEAGVEGAGVSLNARVYVGEDKRLYLSEDFLQPCRTPLRPTTLRRDLDELSAAAGGRPDAVTLVVAPDKTTVERSRLGLRGRRMMVCADRDAGALRRFAALEPVRVLDGVGVVRDAAARNPQREWYTAIDTHWLPETGALVMRSLVQRLGVRAGVPGLGAEPFVADTQHPMRYGDLRVLSGQAPAPVVVPTLRPQRRGAVTRMQDVRLGEDGVARRFTTVGARVVPGRTLVVYDSFIALMQFGNDPTLGQVVPYFGDVTLVHWQSLRAFLATHPTFDRVVFEVVQRNAGEVASRLRNPDLRSALSKALQG